MSGIHKTANFINAILLATVAVMFFLPQCRVDSQAYHSTLTGLNLTLGTRPSMHMEGMSDEEYQKLIDAAQGLAQAAGQNLPKPQDSTDLDFLGVLLLPALAAIAFAQAAFKPQINSIGARVGGDLRACSVGLVLILFAVYGVRGFTAEQAIKQQNADLKNSMAQAQAQAAKQQADYARLTGTQLPQSTFQGMADIGQASLERQIATVRKTPWFDLGFALSGIAFCLAIATRFMGKTPIALARQPMPIVSAAEQLPENAANGSHPIDTTSTWDSIKTRTMQFVGTAEAKAAEAVEASKVEVRLHHEKAAVAACKKQLDQLALECGAAAADVSTFSDPTLQALRQKVLDARQKMKESQSQHDAAEEELGRIDAKANPTKAAELTAWIKATDATVRRQRHDLDAILKDLGIRVLTANLAEPGLTGFYRQRDEIQRQVDEHSANIARLEQEQIGHKASLGFSVKKAIIIGGAAVATLAILVWIVLDLV